MVGRDRPAGRGPCAARCAVFAEKYDDLRRTVSAMAGQMLSGCVSGPGDMSAYATYGLFPFWVPD